VREIAQSAEPELDREDDDPRFFGQPRAVEADLSPKGSADHVAAPVEDYHHR
jgi:hypothetical protein